MPEGDSRRRMTPFFIAPVLGLLSLILPGLPTHAIATLVSPFALWHKGVDQMGFATMALLFLSGVLLGGAFRGKASWKASFLVFAAIPILMLVEMLRDPTSHNLWPFELVMYGVLTLITLLGAGTAILVRRVVTRVLGSGAGGGG